MSENRRIARAAGVVGGLTLLSRCAGLLRDAVVGYYFGTGAAADAFFVAFRLPNLLRRFVAEGAMSNAFVPVFTDYLTTRSRAAATEAAAALATLMAGGLAALTACGVLFAPQWTALFAPGFEAVPGKFALTVTLTRLLFPYIFLISLTALAAAMLNAVRHFAAPAAAPVVLNLSIIAAAVVVCPRLPVPIEGLAYGVLAGGCLQLALQLPPLSRRGMRPRLRWRPRHPAVRRTLGLMGPMVFGAAVYQINLMVDTVLASILPSGSVSYLWYAGRVFEFPLGIFAVALGTAALPSYAAQAARRAYGELRRSCWFAVRLTNCIAVPATAGIIVLATPITAVLFQRGAFGQEQVELTARALTAFALGLWSVSLLRVLVPVFYALGDTRTPVLTAAAAFVANAVCSLLLMGPVAAAGGSRFAAALAAVTRSLAVADLRHVGLALSASVAATLNVALLAVALRYRLRRLTGEAMPSAGVAASCVRSLAAAVVMCPAVRAVAAAVDWRQPGHLAAHGMVLLAAVAAGVVTFTVVFALLGGEEVQWMTARLRERRGRPAALPR